MGMYTELRVRAYVRHKYRDLVAFVTDGGTWREAVEKFPKFPWLRDWAAFSRSSMIPFGGSAYFDDDPAWKTTFNADDGYWQFQCNLKNYSGTIEHFLSHILPEMAHHVAEAWEQYEEAERPRKVGVTCFAPIDLEPTLSTGEVDAGNAPALGGAIATPPPSTQDRPQ